MKKLTRSQKQRLTRLLNNMSDTDFCDMIEMYARVDSAKYFITCAQNRSKIFNGLEKVSRILNVMLG
jgi:hypothetical protein